MTPQAVVAVALGGLLLCLLLWLIVTDWRA